MRIPVRTITVTATLAATLAVAACSSGPDHGGMDAMSGTGTARPSSSTAGGAADVMFAQMMVPHHQQAVEMADLALARAASPELKSLATRIKAAQAPEISTMNGWLEEWGAPATAGGMDHGTDGMMTDAEMTRLRAASGQPFDRLWLTMMIAHHRGAVAMAEDTLASTRNSRVRTLAENVVDSQTEEIATMKGLLAAR